MEMVIGDGMIAIEICNFNGKTSGILLWLLDLQTSWARFF